MAVTFQIEGYITFKDGIAASNKQAIIRELNKTIEKYGDLIKEARITAYTDRDELNKDTEDYEP